MITSPGVNTEEATEPNAQSTAATVAKIASILRGIPICGGQETPHSRYALSVHI